MKDIIHFSYQEQAKMNFGQANHGMVLNPDNSPIFFAEAQR
jgi:hypothetical protein